MKHKKHGSCHHSTQGSPPVMFCQTAHECGSSKQLERGSTPSTPDHVHRHDQHHGHAHASPHAHKHASRHSHKRKEKRRMKDLLFFRCTPEDHAIIAARAAEAGLEQSSYLRRQAVGKSVVRRCRRIRADWDRLRKCMASINKAGNVVNQYIKLFRWFGIGNTAEADKAFNDLSITSRLICTILRRSK